MAIIYSYPLNTPKPADLLIGTIVHDEDDDNSPKNKPTVSFTVQSILNLIGTGGVQTLQQVTNLGSTTTNSITITSDIKVSGRYYDSSNQPGVNGQILSSTNVGTQWINNTSLGVTSVGLSMPAAFTVTNSPITQTGTLTVAGAGIAAQYINGAGNLATLLDIPGLITSLTTNGSGAATLNAGILNIPTNITGTGSVTRVAFWSSADGLTSDSNFHWDNTNKRLGIGTIFPVNTLQVVGGNNADGPSAHRFQVTSSFVSNTNDNSSKPGIQLGYQNKSDVTYDNDNTYKTITPNLGVVAGGLGGIGGGATTITTATLGSNAYGTNMISNVTFADQSKTKIGMVVTYSIPTPNRVYGDGTAAQIYIMELDMPSGVITLSQSIYADAGATLHFSYPAGVGVKIYQPAVVDGTYDASSNYTWYDNPGWYQAARFDQFGGVGFGQGLEQGDTEIGTVTLAGAATRAGGEGITSGGLNPVASTKLKFINRYTNTPGTYQERQAYISLNYAGSNYGDLELNPSGGNASSLSKIKFVGYGSGNKTGTAAYNLSVDSSGKIIETANPSSGTVRWLGSASGLGNSITNANTGSGSNINIGIGSSGGATDPKLNVIGQAIQTVGSFRNNSYINTNSKSVIYGQGQVEASGGNAHVLGLLAVPNGFTGSEPTVINTGPAINFNAKTISSADRSMARISAFAKATATNNTAPGYLKFETTPTGANAVPIERLRIDSDGSMQMPSYGSGTVTGTATYNLSVDSTGKIIETNSLGYTVYTALLTQAGTAAPVATILQNTTGGTFTWTRQSAGNYTVTASTALFTVNKTIVFGNQGNEINDKFQWNRTSDTTLDLIVYENRLNNGSFEIRIYS
tara:strand:- start:31 stop:2604 length:2574 start_codon:yes stop_codon:yes gene_type:complete